jgi:predicted nucleotidyltransferase
MSSTAPRAAVAELFAAFGRAMRARGARWYVYGGQAVLVYGRPRMTVDVDITVDTAGASAAELLETLEQHGFAPMLPGSGELLATLRLLRIVHVATEIPLDVVLAAEGIEQEMLARARIIDLEGVEVPVISVEDLIALKVLAGRRKDLEDVRGVLLAQAGRVDLDRTRAVLAVFQQGGHERAGLLAKLDGLLGATRAGKARRTRSPPRGRG